MGEARTQAKAARNVGLDTLIEVNQAQRRLPPSNVLLKATMNSVVGAVWVDAQRHVPTIQALIQKLRYVKAQFDQRITKLTRSCLRMLIEDECLSADDTLFARSWLAALAASSEI